MRRNRAENEAHTFSVMEGGYYTRQEPGVLVQVHVLSQRSAYALTWASRGWQVQNNQLHDNRVILLPDHKPPIKTRRLPVLHAPHSTALCGIYMAPKCLFYCLMGKLSITMAELIANDLGRCDTRYCGNI